MFDSRAAPDVVRPGPFIQRGSKLVGSGATGVSFEGAAVAISADGSTMLIGGFGDNNDVGAAWVFERANGTWRQQARLVGTGTTAFDGRGGSVALSADGSMALIGGPGADGDRGAAWVFGRANGVWSQQAKLVATGALVNAEQGFSVALSADGSTALIGGPGDDGDLGAAWAFSRVNGTWTQQAKLVGSGATGNASQGIRVALSGDGRTALVGGSADNSGAGATWVFTRAHGLWGQGLKLTASDAAGSPFQGIGLALSADGSTALIGGSADSGNAGAAWVFTRNHRAWSQQGPKLVGAGAVGAAGQGSGVALSGDGNTALIGGPGDNGNLGAVWEFTRANGAWGQQGAKLLGTGVRQPDVVEPGQGFSVALSASGNTALVGDPNDDGGRGATWVFVQGQAVAPPSNHFTVYRIRTSADGTIRFRVTVPGPGRIDVLETAWNDNLARSAVVLQPADGRFVFARRFRAVNYPGSVRITVMPNGQGRRLVAHHTYRVTLRLWVTYTPAGGIYRSIGFHGLHLPG